MSKHTPGPWKARLLPMGVYLIEIRPQETICAIASQRENHHANARLIAAAPELLEALKNAVCWLTDLNATPEELREFESLIKKAEGTDA